MLSVNLKDRVRKKLGMKTSDEKVDEGLRAMRDILDQIGEHDLALDTDDMLYNGSMVGKCIFSLMLYTTIPILAMAKTGKSLKEIKNDLKKD